MNKKIKEIFNRDFIFMIIGLIITIFNICVNNKKILIILIFLYTILYGILWGINIGKIERINDNEEE